VENNTLNQQTFTHTYTAAKEAAKKGKSISLIVREHPRATREGDALTLPQEPKGLRVVRAEGPEFTYDEVANAAEIIVCQSTSTEVLYSPYRGSIAAVSGYAGSQEKINTEVFGSAGVELLRRFPDIAYIDSEEALTRRLMDFKERPLQRSVVGHAVETIGNRLLS